MKHSLVLAYLSALLLALLACAPPRVIYQRVEVPVAVPCPPPPADALTDPDLPIYHLTGKPEDPAFLPRWQAQVAKAYVDSTVILLRELRARTAILRGYVPKEAKP